MLNARCLFIPFVVQALCMGVDELYFHWRRKLPRWERIGHPLDTLTVLACFGWLMVVPPGTLALSIYAGLSIFSCLFVTKDEPVHQRLCSPGEHWLHALLFTMHPLVLISAALLWPALWPALLTAGHGQSLSFLRYEGSERAFFLGNALLTFGFGLFQMIYWNFIWTPKPSKPVRSTTTSITR